VVVDSDAFKATDVIYKALNAGGHHDDMLPTAELVCILLRIEITLMFILAFYCYLHNKLSH
jgi:hypothetical protein